MRDEQFNHAFPNSRNGSAWWGPGDGLNGRLGLVVQRDVPEPSGDRDSLVGGHFIEAGSDQAVGQIPGLEVTADFRALTVRFKPP